MEGIMKYARRLIMCLTILSIMFTQNVAYAKEQESDAAIESNTEISIDNKAEDSSIEASSEGNSSEYEYATSTVDDAVDAGKGVVQINCVYKDDDGNSHIIKGATGFIVGTQDNNSKQYLITSKQGIIPDKKTRKAAIKSFGIKTDNLNDEADKYSFEVVVTMDMAIECSLYQQSEELDIAVFSLSENLVNRKPLSIFTSDDGSTSNLPYGTTDIIHSIGFPDEISYESNPKRYDKKDIIISSGKIVNVHSLNDICVITHDAEVGPNNCGGPLLNENGDVIGMNVLKKDGQYSVAIDSTMIVDVLDSFGISYNKLTPSTIKPEEKPKEEPSVVYISGQQGDGDGKQPEIPSVFVVAIIAIVVFLLATMIAVIMILLGKKPAITKEERELKAKERAEKKAKKKEEKEKKALPPRPFPKHSTDDNENQSGGTGMETNELGKKADEGTMLLYDDPIVNIVRCDAIIGGTLIRKKTKENILLNKPVTTLGKDSLHVDYCIRDNSAISRIHATFTVNSQGVCVEDKDSTNGTFVNGTRLGAGEARMLNKGDVIRLANEEFEYRK